MTTEKKKGFFARILDSNTIRYVAPGAWIQWRQTTDQYRGIGYQQGKMPPESGDLLVQSPYTDWYNLTWGLAPNQDMPKWRWMYRAREEIRRGVDTKVEMAVGRGLSVVCEDDDDIEKFANQLLDRLNIRNVLQSAVTDALVYGQAYFEKVRVVNNDEQAGENLDVQAPEGRQQAEVTRKWNRMELDVNTENPEGSKRATENLKNWIADVEKVDAWLDMPETKKRLEADRKRYLANTRRRFQALDTTKVTQNVIQPTPDKERGALLKVSDGELVELKPLDPLWMRINRDAFGNVIGFVQWGIIPIPQSIPPEKVVFIKWMPKSWAYESAYGTSILMPVQRHISFLIQAEEDMKIYWHQYAKPRLWVAAGDQQKGPYPVQALSALRQSLANGQPNSDIVTPSDVKVEVLKGGMGDTTSTFKEYVTYLGAKISDALGIPAALQNTPNVVVRATSDVSLQAFIAEEMMIQEIVGEYFMKEVIEPEIRRVFGDKIPIVKAVWRPILEDDRNKKADRLVKAVGNNPFMTVNEARTEMGLKALDKPEYDDLPKTVIPGQPQSKNPEASATTMGQTRDESLEKRDKSP